MNRRIEVSKVITYIKESSLLYVLGLFLIIFVFIVGILHITTNTHNEVDWLNSSDWSHLSGAEMTNDGMEILPTGRVINHRDTSTAQPNPPVNIRGSYLRVPNDFMITMKLSGVDNDATVQFYGEIPVIYDEWRHERPSIRLEANNDGLYVRVWDGTAANSIDERIYSTELQNDITLSIVHSNDEFILQTNGRSLGTIPDHNIFTNGTIWFGADARLDTQGWTLTALTARSLEKEPIELVPSLSSKGNDNDPNSLRGLSNIYTRKLPIGVAVSVGPLFTDRKYNEIALSQFSMITPENSFKPQVIHPQKDLYLFNDTDSLLEVAQNNDMIVHGHALVMGKANPEWMQKTPENERKQVMIDHITALMSRYKGKVAQWDVVNEPLSEDDIDYSAEQKGLRKQMWFDAMGEEYIDIAFRAARAADPDAKLYLNDYGAEKDGKRWDALLDLVKRLQARGVPIDGVGFESHVYHAPADTIDPAILKQHIQSLAAIGIVSRISEIDVLGDDLTFQAQQYSDVLQACLSEPTCTSYGIWGVTDLYGSTALSDRYPVMLGDSLLWDTNYVPKPAFESLQKVLRQP